MKPPMYKHESHLLSTNSSLQRVIVSRFDVPFSSVNTKAEIRFHVQTADWIPLDVRQKIIELVSGYCCSSAYANSYCLILVHLEHRIHTDTPYVFIVFPSFYGAEQEPHQQGRGAPGDFGAQPEPASQPGGLPREDLQHHRGGQREAPRAHARGPHPQGGQVSGADRTFKYY